MEKRRVVVTGLGAVTPIGNNCEDYWNGLLSGKSGIANITLFDPVDHPCKIAAEIKNFNPEDHFDKKEVKKLERFTQCAMVAGREAFKDSGISLDKTDILRFGVIIGVGMGGVATIEEQHDVLRTKGV